MALPSLPARVGPYELQRRLGAGGMAETYLALRHGPAGFRQEVCLKRVLPALAEDRQFVEMFLEEARIQSRLRHGNIVQVYDFGEADGAYYMALELVDGIDLRGLLGYFEERGERLPVSTVLHILRELCRALEVAHGLSIDGVPQHLVHRDISPSNILVSVAGEVKLTDFGIAKSHNREFHTETGHTRGKLGYMAPEQVRGETVDARSDLFALGVVLYLMLTGEHPFRLPDASDYDILSRVVRGERKSLRQAAPSVPSELVALTETLLAVEPGQRPGSAREVIERTSSLMPPAHADRELAGLVQAARRAQEAERSGVQVDPRVSQGTVVGLGSNDPTALASVRESTERVSADASSGGAPTRTSERPPRLAPNASAAEVSEQLAIPGRSSPARAVLLASIVFALAVAAFASLRTGSTSKRDAAFEQAKRAPVAASPPGTTAARGQPAASPDPSVEPPAVPVAALAPVVTLGTPEGAARAQVNAAPVGDTAPLAGDAHAGSALLQIMVSPYGTVSIDGERVGRAPLTKRVGAGAHVIEARDSEQHVERERLSVHAGETRTVRIKMPTKE